MAPAIMGCAPVEGNHPKRPKRASHVYPHGRLRATFVDGVSHAAARKSWAVPRRATRHGRGCARVVVGAGGPPWAAKTTMPSPQPSTDGSKRPATNSRRRASSDGDDERRRRLSSADYSVDVEEVDERIDYVEDVEDEDEEPPRDDADLHDGNADRSGATPATRRRSSSKTSLANRFSRIKY